MTQEEYNKFFLDIEKEAVKLTLKDRGIFDESDEVESLTKLIVKISAHTAAHVISEYHKRKTEFDL